MRKVVFGLAVALGGCFVQAVKAQQATPPMGWNSWNFYAKRIDDKAVRATADALVSSGLRDAGYVYVTIDDGWEGERDQDGVLHPNAKFPDMVALGKYLHDRGLKFGIYSSPGPQTCGHGEGSMGHEEVDAQTFASWGVDLLKYDLCSFSDVMEKQYPGQIDRQYKLMRDAFAKMNQALHKTGRPIVYSLCQYGLDSVWEWGKDVGATTWRTTRDIRPTYERITELGFQQAGLSLYTAPGHWNDPDMLEIGNGKLTEDEAKTHMSLWALLGAPLIAGNDVTHMEPMTLRILGNRKVIGIDQDGIGKSGDRVIARGPIEVWVRHLANGDEAIGIFNRGYDPRYAENVGAILKELRIPRRSVVEDLWGAEVLADWPSSRLTVPKHGVLLLRVHPSGMGSSR